MIARPTDRAPHASHVVPWHRARLGALAARARRHDSSAAGVFPPICLAETSACHLRCPALILPHPRLRTESCGHRTEDSRRASHWCRVVEAAVGPALSG